jgi:NTP pyrophosphatase (non-canonical NTP hydrolase)
MSAREPSNDLVVIGGRQLLDSFRWHPDLMHRSEQAVAFHVAAGLAEEAGEVLGLFKKMDRGDFTYGQLRADPRLPKELADVTMYLSLLCRITGVNPGRAVVDVAARNDVRFCDG